MNVDKTMKGFLLKIINISAFIFSLSFPLIFFFSMFIGSWSREGQYIISIISVTLGFLSLPSYVWIAFRYHQNLDAYIGNSKIFKSRGHFFIYMRIVIFVIIIAIIAYAKR